MDGPISRISIGRYVIARRPHRGFTVEKSTTLIRQRVRVTGCHLRHPVGRRGGIDNSVRNVGASRLNLVTGQRARLVENDARDLLIR